MNFNEDNNKILIKEDEINSLISKIFIKENSILIPIFFKSSTNLNFDLIYSSIKKLLFILNNSQENLINKKYEILNQFYNLILNYPEFIYILNSNEFELQNKFFLFEILINFYFNNINNNEIKEFSLKFIKILIILSNFKKINYDFIYQKISKEFRENQLKNFLFLNEIKLLQFFYESNEIKNNPKSFFYLNNNLNSGIKVNINEKNRNKFSLKNGFSFILWFFSDENINNNCTLIHFLSGNSNKINIFKLNLINNNKITIEIDKKELLNFNLNKNKWIQLKIEFHNNFNNNNEIKIFFDDKEIIINLNNKDFYFNSNIEELSFFNNFIGKFTSIIFFNDFFIQEQKLNYDFGIYSKKIFNQFLNEKFIENIKFIFTPIHYDSMTNVIKDPFNKIKGNFLISNTFNGIYKNKNYINNIFQIGGSKNIIILFEIFNNLIIENNNDFNTNFEIFLELIKLLNQILTNKKFNIIEFHNNNFFKFLNLFFKNIPNVYFNYNDNIINYLIKIGESIFNFINDNNNLIINKHKKDYFLFILFNFDIVIKFNNIQQNLIWFEIIEKQNLNIFLNKEFIFFDMINICKLIIHFNNNNNNNNNFFKIVKIIFNNVCSDNDRENLFKLISNKNLNDNFIINILDIFIDYFEIKNFEINNKLIKLKKINSIEHLLNSNCLYDLLFLLGNKNNLDIKIKIISLMKIITVNFNENVKNYFNSNFYDLNYFNVNNNNENNENDDFEKINDKNLLLYYISKNFVNSEINKNIFENQNIINKIEKKNRRK